MNIDFLVDIKESQKLHVKLVDLIVDGNQNEGSDCKVNDQSGAAEA